MKKFKRVYSPLLVALGVLILLVGLVFVIREIQRIRPSDVSVGDLAVNKLLLDVISASSLPSIMVGDIFTIGVAPNILGTQDITITEIVVKFDPTVLKAIAQREGSDSYLALNKKRDNVAGIVTVDIAYAGPGKFEDGAWLTYIDFEVLKTNRLTKVEVDKASTLGIPNSLATNGYGSLNIQLGSVSSTSTETYTTPVETSTSLGTTSLPTTTSSQTTTTSNASYSSGSTTFNISVSTSKQTSTYSYSYSPPFSFSTSTVAQSSGTISSPVTSSLTTQTTTSEVTSPTTSSVPTSVATTESSVSSDTATSVSTVTATPTTSTSRIIPGVSDNVVLIVLGVLTLATGATAVYMFFKRRRVADVF